MFAILGVSSGNHRAKNKASGHMRIGFAALDPVPADRMSAFRDQDDGVVQGILLTVLDHESSQAIEIERHFADQHPVGSRNVTRDQGRLAGISSK